MPISPLYTDPSSPPVLTQMDVDRLLADPSAESRVAVLRSVAHHYNAQHFGTREHEVAEQIFRLLMKDVALVVRETLAHNLQNNPEIPRDIVLHIAQDVESVATPILTCSSVLSDADLVQLVEASNDLSKLLAIARREHVSIRVSNALVEVHHPDVLNHLLGNPGAEFSEQTLDKIVREFHSDTGIMQILAARDTLPMAIIERMVHESSAAIAVQLKTKYRLSDSQIKHDAASAHDDVLLYLLTNPISDHEMMALVQQMHEANRLSTTLAIKALCRGQYSFFAAVLAVLADIPLMNAKQLLADKGELGIEALYRKAKWPESMLPALTLIIRAVQELADDEAIPGSRLYSNRLSEMVLQAAGGDAILHLPHFMAIIRQPIHPH